MHYSFAQICKLLKPIHTAIHRRGFVALLMLTVSLDPMFAMAGLGDRVSAIRADQEALGASAASTETSLYDVHDLSTEANSVKEYVTKQGVVFAVTWRGVRKPDLTLLLGQYYTEFSKIEKQRKRSRGRQPVSVKTSNIVVRRGGHMRDLHGRAFLQDLVPAGVDVESLP